MVFRATAVLDVNKDGVFNVERSSNRATYYTTGCTAVFIVYIYVLSIAVKFIVEQVVLKADRHPNLHSSVHTEPKTLYYYGGP